MRMKKAQIAVIIALAAALTACGGKGRTDKPAQAPITQPDKPDTPVGPESLTPPEAFQAQLNREDEYFSATASFPPDLDKLAPALAKQLSLSAQAEFESVAGDAALAAKVYGQSFNPFEVDIDWSLTAQCGPLISLSATAYYDTGGAHPNNSLIGIIHDTGTGQTIKASGLFSDPQSAAKRMAAPLRASLLAQKMQRYGENAVPAEIEAELVETLPADSGLSGEVVLVPSTQLGKIGGLKILFSPYEIGPYVEGSYEAVIPQSVFASELKPEYADMFAGEPASGGAE